MGPITWPWACCPNNIPAKALCILILEDWLQEELEGRQVLYVGFWPKHKTYPWFNLLLWMLCALWNKGMEKGNSFLLVFAFNTLFWGRSRRFVLELTTWRHNLLGLSWNCLCHGHVAFLSFPMRRDKDAEDCLESQECHCVVLPYWYFYPSEENSVGTLRCWGLDSALTVK